MKVEIIITVDHESVLPENDDLDDLADYLERETIGIVNFDDDLYVTSSAWRKTL